MKKKIIVAITGHRDMVETEELREKISVFFEDLIEKSKELILLSPLADGADRFVAKIFLEKKKTYENLKLFVPMPFELERYLEDFDEASKQEFVELGEHAEQGFSVSADPKTAYLDVGRYVVDESDILLALWDGTFNGKVGGTGDVVNYARKRKRKVVHFLCEREEALVK